MDALKEWNKFCRLIAILGVLMYVFLGILEYITPISNNYGEQHLDVSMGFTNFIGGIGVLALIGSLVLTIVITIKSKK